MCARARVSDRFWGAEGGGFRGFRVSVECIVSYKTSARNKFGITRARVFAHYCARALDENTITKTYSAAPKRTQKGHTHTHTNTDIALNIESIIVFETPFCFG